MKKIESLSKWFCFAVCASLLIVLLEHMSGWNNLLLGIKAVVQAVFYIAVVVAAVLVALLIATYLMMKFTEIIEKYVDKCHPDVDPDYSFYSHVSHAFSFFVWLIAVSILSNKQNFSDTVNLICAMLIAGICAICMVKHLKFSCRSSYCYALSISHLVYAVLITTLIAFSNTGHMVGHGHSFRDDVSPNATTSHSERPEPTIAPMPAERREAIKATLEAMSPKELEDIIAEINNDAMARATGDLRPLSAEQRKYLFSTEPSASERMSHGNLEEMRKLLIK